MAKSNAEKQERNDVYTAFVVLGLFVLFGFFISRLNGTPEEVETVWVEKPESPSGYQGYPFPHDDKSITRLEQVKEELTPLPKRTMRPIVSMEPVAKTMSAVAPGAAATVVAIAPEQKVELASPSERVIEVVKEKATKLEPPVEAPKRAEPKPAAKPTPKPTVEKPKPVVKPAPKPKTSSSTVVKGESGMRYITSNLPCVWVVGIFKNPSNVNRVVARLRLNKFDVGTGAHEKGTYVGVPCECKANDSKQAQLREIFSAQPWMLRK